MDNVDEYVIYVLKVVPGREEIVVKYISANLNKEEIQDSTFLTFSELKKDKNGNKKIIKIKIAPGYVFIKSQPINKYPQLFYKIKNIPFVIGFLSTCDKKIIPMSETDIKKFEILNQKLENTKNIEELITTFKIGDSVIITSGPFRNMLGSIKEINVNKNVVSLLITIFGRLIPLEINMSNIKLLT